MPKVASSSSQFLTRARQSSLSAPTSFASEAHLVETIRSLFDGGRSKRWVWLKEFSSPSGTADLVAASLKNDWQENLSLSLVPSRWLYALKRISLGSIVTTDSFAATFGISKTTARDVLTAYASANYCQYSTNHRGWVKTSDPYPLTDKIVAIEAKLRDWRRALYQAVQYASFATESWVVIDARYGHTVELDEFERREIGLVAVSNDQECEVLISATTRSPRMPERYWHANGEISKRLLTAD